MKSDILPAFRAPRSRATQYLMIDFDDVDPTRSFGIINVRNGSSTRIRNVCQTVGEPYAPKLEK